MAYRANADFAAVQEAFKHKTKDSDPRFFIPTKDADGKVGVIGRFLYAPSGSPVVEKKIHYYDGPGGKINTWCRYALGERCPICGASMDAYKADNKILASDLRSSSKFILNFLVVKDPIKPENDGKVFLIEVGQKVYKKIKAKTAPDNNLDKPENIFHYFDGSNFKLIGLPSSFINKAGKKIEYIDYDSSSFDAPSKLTQKQAEDVDKHLHDIEYWRDPSNFKSTDELQVILDEATGVSINNTAVTAPQTVVQHTAVTTAVTPAAVESLARATPTDSGGDDDWMAALQESMK